MEPAALTEAMGLVAGLLTTIAYLPQVVKVWVGRSARDVSLGMFVIMNIGIALWLVYGIAIDSLALILANSVTLLLTLAVLIGKVKFDRS